ncbi:MAG: argininosuccinate lyase [Deltaproteobacteria bacterium]|nr:argininosuccinate lyase [Deltaproteobacteria bacterium]
MAREKKLWGGRFAAQTASSVEAFASSIDVDSRLYRQDIAGSVAHARMLARQRIISAREGQKIVRGLKAIQKEIESGDFHFSSADEDIHMNIERRLTQRIGPAGEKLHTARSRNDQVALDMRLYLREELEAILKVVEGLKLELARAAKRYLKVIMPGYTHLQRAQPVLFSHHLLAYVDMLDRDKERMSGCLERINVMPLGSGALAGTTFPIDRAYVAKLLNFPRISKNSIDAVSDRDFVLEFLSVSAILFVHLSRLAEEMILWSSIEFGFIEIPDRYCTGSSMMPQKKNPDVLELVRAKYHVVLGEEFKVKSMISNLISGYNRDLQLTKEPVISSVEIAKSCIKMMILVVSKIKIDEKKCKEALTKEIYATEEAYKLVKKGIPFREAYKKVSRKF